MHKYVGTDHNAYKKLKTTHLFITISSKDLEIINYYIIGSDINISSKFPSASRSNNLNFGNLNISLIVKKTTTK